MLCVKKEKGIALVFVVLSVSVLLGIAFGISSILINQTKILRNIGHSVVSFYAADAGIENVLLNRPPLDIQEVSLSNGAKFSVDVTAGGEGDCDESLAFCVKSVGEYKDTKRAIEVVYGGIGEVVTADININGLDGTVFIVDGASWSYSWDSYGASSCVLTSPSGTSTVAISGTGGPINPEHDWYPEVEGFTTLELECSSASKTFSDSVTVRIAETPQVLADIDINGSDGPADVTEGESWSYSWESTNAGYCILTSPSGTSTVAVSGSGGPIAQEHDWYPEVGESASLSIECFNPYGSASDTVSVNIIAPFVCGDNVTFTYNGSSVTYGTVESQGECWLDRNLGALQVATAYNDSSAYGDLFQWGRLDDGHQERTSDTVNVRSDSDIPEHNDFITIFGLGEPFEYDWRNPQNDNLWQGASGINNPCPSGWRIPTRMELEIERVSWSSNNYNGAYASPLKLTAGGSRESESGALYDVGNIGNYWSSETTYIYSSYLLFTSSGAMTNEATGRANGLSVRCIKD